MYQKIKNKIKKFFSPIFELKDNEKEKGVAILDDLIIAAIVIVAVGAIGAVGYYSGAFGSIAEWGVRQVMGILFGMVSSLFGLSTALFSSITSSSVLQSPITKQPVVLMGWGIVRDFANMFIVLGFVVVGIATILRIREYEAQKLLLPLIMVALLINFSPLICGLVIDASNIMMNYFLNGMNAGGVATSAEAITTPFRNAIFLGNVAKNIEEKYAGKNADIVAYVSAYTSLSITVGIAAMIFFIYGILLLLRYVALMCLVILSPLAFVCYVFSATKSIFSKWWNQFVQWAFIGVSTAFFLYLGGHILTQTAGLKSGDVGTNLAFWVPTAFLLFAYSLIFQISAVGAGAAIGLATGAVGFAMGAGKKVAGFGAKQLADRTGLSRAGAAVAGGAARFGERLGVVKRGTAAKWEAGRMKKAEDAVKNITDDNELVQTATRRGISGTSRINAAAATRKLAQQGKLDLIPAAQRHAAIANAVTHNPESIGDFEKADYHYAANNNARVTRIMQNRGVDRNTAEGFAQEQVLDENITNMSYDQLRNISADHLAGAVGHRRLDRLTHDKYRAFQDAPDALRQTVRAHTPQFAREALTSNQNYQNAVASNDQAAARVNLEEAKRQNKIVTAIQNIP